MAIVQFSVAPVGTGSPSVGDWVVKLSETVRKSGIKNRLTPMSTILEGDLKEILDLIRKIHEETFSDECKRVITDIKIDDRTDKPLTMDGKIQRVEKGLTGE